MTAHRHATIVEGCYRCELNRDEVQYSEDWDALEAIIRDAIERCRFPEDVSIDAAEAVMSWARTDKGREVMGRAIK